MDITQWFISNLAPNQDSPFIRVLALVGGCEAYPCDVVICNDPAYMIFLMITTPSSRRQIVLANINQCGSMGDKRYLSGWYSLFGSKER